MLAHEPRACPGFLGVAARIARRVTRTFEPFYHELGPSRHTRVPLSLVHVCSVG